MKKKKSQILFRVKKDDFFFHPSWEAGGGPGFVFVFFLGFCFSHVYKCTEQAWRGHVRRGWGLETEQMGALDGPLRGSARLGKAAFEWVKGINLS